MAVAPILHNIHSKNQRVPKVSLVLHPNHLVVDQITQGVPNLLAVDVETLFTSLVFVMEGAFLALEVGDNVDETWYPVMAANQHMTSTATDP